MRPLRAPDENRGSISRNVLGGCATRLEPPNCSWLPSWSLAAQPSSPTVEDLHENAKFVFDFADETLSGRIHRVPAPLQSTYAAEDWGIGVRLIGTYRSARSSVSRRGRNKDGHRASSRNETPSRRAIRNPAGDTEQHVPENTMSAQFFRKAGDAWILSAANSEKAIQMLAEQDVEALASDPIAAAGFLRRVILYYGISESSARAALEATIRSSHFSYRGHCQG